VRALSIFFLEFRFPGHAQRFLALQRFLGLVGNRSLASPLDIGLPGRPVLIPSTLPVAVAAITPVAPVYTGMSIIRDASVLPSNPNENPWTLPVLSIANA